jgi:nitrogenase molybdenum-iron protein alpha/beta subunit
LKKDKPGVTTEIPATGLEQFELRDVDSTDLLGIFMGVHAVPGVIMLLHTTVGCKFKTQLQITDHDWGRESHNQRLWTGVDDAKIIVGSGERLIEFGTTWYQRRKPDVFIVTTNASVELSAFDVEAAVRELQLRLPIPVIYLKAPGHEGTIFGGYKRFIEAVLPLLDKPSSQVTGQKSGSPSVVVGGYFFDRFEMEHAANINELRRLLTGCGMTWAGALFDGSPWEKVKRCGAADNFVWLPYGHAVAGTADHASDGRTHLETDLPVGLTGTSVFLDRLCERFGLDRTVVDAVKDRELAKAVPLIKRAAKVLAGTRVAVFLDTPAAAAVTSFLSELDIEVPLVFLTDAAPAPTQALALFDDTCARLGASFPHKPEVHAGISRNEQYRIFMEESARDSIPLVIGSSQQKRAFHGDIRVIEMGYPAAEKHWLYPVPWLGYNGAIALTQRLLDALMRVY